MSPPVRPDIRLKDAVRFFLPLILMTELNMISKSIIHAALARLKDPKRALGGFNVAFTFYYSLASGSDTAVQTTIAYLRDKRSLWHLLGFFTLMLSPAMTVAGLVALTPLGAWFYTTVFGTSAEMAAQAQGVTLVLMLSTPVLVVRGVAFSLILMNRRTVFITWSTLLRLSSLAISLLVLPRLSQHAVVGAWALVICMAVETALASRLAFAFWRALPDTSEGPLPRYRELWRFTWPLLLNQIAEQGVVVVINIYLGRLLQADLALAAFGVVQGLANVLLSPMRNLVQTAQTLARRWPDVKVLLRFTGWLSAVFAGGALALFATPLGGWILAGPMGLTPELQAYSRPALYLVILVSLFWGWAALFRGLLAGVRRTGAVALAGAGRLGTVALLGALGLVIGLENGAVLGMVAWAAAFGMECGILGWRLFIARDARGLYGR